MNCSSCGNPISERRLQILPNTQTCVACSKEQRAMGLTIYTHKSTAEVVVIRTDDPEVKRQAWNAYARSRGNDYNPNKTSPLSKCFK